jgi:hypothetical protein
MEIRLRKESNANGITRGKNSSIYISTVQTPLIITTGV